MPARHRALPPERVWSAVACDRERIEVFGHAVDVPSVPVRALHVVLHLRPKDRPGSKAWVDLGRALARVELQVWNGMAALAADLDMRQDGGQGARCEA